MSSPTLDRVLDAVLRVDANFDIHFISEPGQQWLTRISGAELPTNFTQLVHPDDTELLQRSLAAPDSFNCDLRLIKDDKEVWINLRSYLLPAARQYVFCIFDISMWKTEN